MEYATFVLSKAIIIIFLSITLMTVLFILKSRKKLKFSCYIVEAVNFVGIAWILIEVNILLIKNIPHFIKSELHIFNRNQNIEFIIDMLFVKQLSIIVVSLILSIILFYLIKKLSNYSKSESSKEKSSISLVSCMRLVFSVSILVALFVT